MRGRAGIRRSDRSASAYPFDFRVEKSAATSSSPLLPDRIADSVRRSVHSYDDTFGLRAIRLPLSQTTRGAAESPLSKPRCPGYAASVAIRRAGDGKIRPPISMFSTGYRQHPACPGRRRALRPPARLTAPSPHMFTDIARCARPPTGNPTSPYPAWLATGAWMRKDRFLLRRSGQAGLRRLSMQKPSLPQGHGRERAVLARARGRFLAWFAKAACGGCETGQRGVKPPAHSSSSSSHRLIVVVGLIGGVMLPVARSSHSLR